MVACEWPWTALFIFFFFFARLFPKARYLEHVEMFSTMPETNSTLRKDGLASQRAM